MVSVLVPLARCHGHHCLVAIHRPLQGVPVDAAFHFPEPTLPLSWPLAKAPPSETLTMPLFPILPDTSAAPETFPSATTKG
jgi:hypothetical protein